MILARRMRPAAPVHRRRLALRRPSLRRREPLDDVSLAHKVESELSRRAGVPKGQIVVSAEDGVVFLRGVMDRQEDVQSLEDATRRIAGVRGVDICFIRPARRRLPPPEARTAAV